MISLGDLADWYLEIAKIQNKDVGAHGDAPILASILPVILKLWHPFMPFVTEHIWKTAGFHGDLITANGLFVSFPCRRESGSNKGFPKRSGRSLPTSAVFVPNKGDRAGEESRISHFMSARNRKVSGRK